MALRGPSWPFVDQERCSPRPSVDSPNYDLSKVFSAALRGPPWPSVDKRGVLRGPSLTAQIMTLQRFSSWPFVDKKSVLPGPPWTAQIMTFQRFSPRPSVALRGQKRCSPRPFVDSPNYDPAKVFFVALRGQKKCSPLPSWTDQNMTLQISIQTNVNQPYKRKELSRASGFPKN